MCTITFIPLKENDYILTSNRDEAPGRETVPPEIYVLNGVEMLFPKDEVAGGTWIGTSKKNRLVCLMNGGFIGHERKGNYRMSRGLIVTHLLTVDNALSEIESFDFLGIEPFTIIMVEWGSSLKIYQLVWDGTLAHLEEKPLKPQIWSSSLLYIELIKKKRELWFSEFLITNENPTEMDLLDFHRTAGEGNPATNLIMNRDFVKTKSITQIIKKGYMLSMRYEDLEKREINNSNLYLTIN